ncbi:DUF4276 family protein [Zoogloea sp.]|uniref:DUF4276 family protein n=1 Tax=Zoogloea sp. TaxID=49181 RepID=UPI001AC81DEB|nr:DUF4276 family protein [Zoogloea sp.]MBN8284399.1 DUF4276 family protein [Zoogloea sp.]
MHYLGLALYAEGPTDYYFLRPLLQRLCEDLCARGARQPVEFSAVLELDDPIQLKNASRDARIVGAARAAQGAWQLLFVHSDGEAAPAKVRAERTAPALARLQQEFGEAYAGVAVVPIRETEAWAMFDTEAVREVFGTTQTADDLGLPLAAAMAEATADPKRTLDDAFLATNPSGRRRKQGVSPMLNALGERASLQRLRQLPSFVVLETELREALLRLRVL